MFQAVDWVIVAMYFAVIFGVAFWARGRSAGGNAEDYFLAGRNAGWFVVGASLFASNIGSEHLIGLAGSGSESGVAVAQFEMLAALILLLLGWLFVPFYLRSGIFTAPEFLERRYSSGPRMYLAGISVIAYVLTKISVTISAGGIVFETLLGIDFWVGSVLVVVATGLYTVLGGLRAVMYTDSVQAVVLFLGALMVTILGLNAIGGWDALVEGAGPEMMSLWKPISHPDFPWTGILTGAPILGIWYWCTDQFIVQRVLAAKSIGEARRGAIFAGFLKQGPLFIFVIPGMIAFVLMQSGSLQYDSHDQALPALIGAILPVGVRGLVVAGLLAALMSSLSSVFNSCATLFTMDIYRKFHPDVSERTEVVVGRISVVVLIILGLAWIPAMKLVSGQLFTYIQSVQAYISPPVAAVFLFGLLWTRATARGAMVTLLFGFVGGIGRLILDINKDSLDGVLLAIAEINFLHFGFFLFIISSVVLFVVSLMDKEPDQAQVEGLTLANLPAADATEEDSGRGMDRWLSFGLAAVVGILWLWFSGLVY